jgi:20S proteasome alpha/beta subunit
MTLIIAAPGKDFVIIAADSRGVIDFGSGRAEVNTHKKIAQLTKYVSVLMYGSSEEGNQLVEKYKEQLDPKLEYVDKVAEDFCNFCRNEERALADVPKNPDSYVSFGFLVCGIKIKKGKYTPLVYSLHNDDGFRLGLCKPFAIKGKPLIAYYLFARDYTDDMPVNKLCTLVAQSVYDTMQIDGDVGGQIRISIIDSEGTRELSDADVNEHYKTWTLKKLEEIIQA